MVRQSSAKALFIGSIPIAASNLTVVSNIFTPLKRAISESPFLLLCAYSVPTAFPALFAVARIAFGLAYQKHFSALSE